MSKDEPVVYVKLGSDGQVIEREASTPAEHVQFKGTGWVIKDSALGRRVTHPRKTDTAEGQSATSVTAHAAAAQKAEPVTKTTSK